jgi:hypothetical protein
MAEYRIRVLHLSDLHLGKGGASEAWRTRRVLGDAWIRNLDDIVADGRAVDLVCFTGDVAFSGQAAQYREATAFFQETLERLRVGPQRFFPIPGNHDIDRGVDRAAWRKLRSHLGPDDGIGLSRWMGGGDPPRGIVGSAREKMLDRQQAYRDWIAICDRTRPIARSGGNSNRPTVTDIERDHVSRGSNGHNQNVVRNPIRPPAYAPRIAAATHRADARVSAPQKSPTRCRRYRANAS